MDSQQVTTTHSEEEALPSSTELRARLAPGPKTAQDAVLRPRERPKRKFSLSAPAWTLIGALTLFTCAILAKSNAPVRHALAPGEGIKLVDPRLLPAAPDAVALANLARAVKDYKALNDGEVSKVLDSLRPGKPALDTSQQQGIQRLLAKPELARLLDDLSLPTYATPPRIKNEPWFPFPRLGLVAGLYAKNKLQAGETQEAMRAYRALLTLYPRMEASHGGTAWQLAYSAAAQSVSNASALWQDRTLSADQLQSLLNEMQPPQSVAAEEDAVRYLVSQDLVNQLSDRGIINGLLESFKISASGGLDPQTTFMMANRVALATLKNLQRPWAEQDRSEATWLQSATEEARMYGEQNSAMTDWLANLAERRTAHASKNLIGMVVLSSSQFILTGQPDTMFGARTSYEAARTILGMAVYERRFGKSVHALHELVDAGIFKELPKDPYTGQPFFLDRMRERIWSVGPDGINNGGGVHNGAVPGGQADHVYYLNTP